MLGIFPVDDILHAKNMEENKNKPQTAMGFQITVTATTIYKFAFVVVHKFIVYILGLANLFYESDHLKYHSWQSSDDLITVKITCLVVMIPKLQACKLRLTEAAKRICCEKDQWLSSAGDVWKSPDHFSSLMVTRGPCNDRSKGARGTPPPAKISLLSCSVREKLLK